MTAPSLSDDISRTYDRLGAQIEWLSSQSGFEESVIAKAVLDALSGSPIASVFGNHSHGNVIWRLAVLWGMRAPFLLGSFFVSGPLHLRNVVDGKTTLALAMATLRKSEAARREDLSPALRSKVLSLVGPEVVDISTLWSEEGPALSPRLQAFRVRKSSDEGKSTLDEVVGEVAVQVSTVLQGEPGTELATRLRRALDASSLTSLDVANILRARVRFGLFYPPEVESEWLRDPSLLSDIANALAVDFDNVHIPVLAMQLDLVHAQDPARRLRIEELLDVSARPVPAPADRRVLASVPLPDTPEALCDAWQRTHSDPSAAWRVLRDSFFSARELWGDATPETEIRAVTLRRGTPPEALSRLAWRLDFQLRYLCRIEGDPRVLRGWNSAPRGFLTFDWLGVEPLPSCAADARILRLEATSDFVEELWAAIVAADIVDPVQPFSVEPADEQAWVYDLTCLKMLAGADPRMEPRLESEVKRAVASTTPDVIRAGLHCAAWLPAEQLAALRPVLAPLAEYVDHDVNRLGLRTMAH